MSDNEKQRKRDRGANYTHEEKALLVDLIKQYKDIVENKNSGAIVTNQKKEVWREITRKYNSNCTTGPRGTDQLKALYDNLKQKARRNVGESNVIKKKTEYVKTQKILAQIEALQAEADLKKELETMKEDKVQITGGGFWKIETDDVMQDQTDPLSNPYDSRPACFKDNSDSDLIQLTDLTGPIKREHSLEPEVVIDESQPHMEQYPQQPVPKRENVPRNIHSNPYDSGPAYFKDDSGSYQIEVTNLTGPIKREHSIEPEVVIDESQPHMERYPSQPVPTGENVPRYLVPSTSFNSHGEDAKETVSTDQQKLRKPMSIDALKRSYLKKKWQNSCLERKRIMQDILHSKMQNHRQQQEHNMKLIILKKKLEMLNNKAVIGKD